MSEWFVINDISEFTDKARTIVYNNFGLWDSNDQIDIMIDDVAENEKEDFDKILSHQESLSIIKERAKKQKSKKSKNIRYILNDQIFAAIIEALNDRMISNILNSLVKKGLIESAFDNESNDFIFWIKEDDNKEKEKPETD